MIDIISPPEHLESVATRPEYILDQDVLFAVAPDKSARLCKLDGNFFALTATGAEMLRIALIQGIGATVERISHDYNMDAGRIRRDLDLLLCELLKHGLVQRYGKAGWSPKGAPRIAAFVFKSVFRLTCGGAKASTAQIWLLVAFATASLRLIGWSRTVKLWQKCFPITSPKTSDSSQAMRLIANALRKAAGSYPLGMSCKERALCCWALLRSAGIPGTLVLGVSLFPLASHCWCEHDSYILTDFPDQCELFTPIRHYR